MRLARTVLPNHQIAEKVNRFQNKAVMLKRVVLLKNPVLTLIINLYNRPPLKATIDAKQIRFLLCPPYAALLKTTIIEATDDKFTLLMVLSTPGTTNVTAIKIRAVVRKKRRQVNGITAKRAEVIVTSAFR